MLLVESSSPAAGCIEACRRCRVVAEVLTAALHLAPQTRQSVAAHLRHCAEHLSAVLDGMSTGIVDYDARKRDPELERNPALLAAHLDRLSETLECVEADAADRRLHVRVLACAGGSEGNFASSLGRELAFASSHAIHHLAVVRLLLTADGVELPPDLDLAYSTARHLSHACGVNCCTAPAARSAA